MKVLFFYRGERAKLIKEVEAGLAPDEFLYGLPQLRKLGFEVSFAEAAPGDGEFTRKLVNPFGSFIGNFLCASFALSNIVIYWKRIKESDAIIGTTDGNTLPLLAARWIGQLDKPVVGVTQGLYDMKRKLGWRPWRSFAIHLVTRMLDHAQRIIVLGEGDRQAFCDTFGKKFDAIITDAQFGVDCEFWSPGTESSSATDSPLLSVGSDCMRDYDTLLRATGDEALRIVTRLKVDESLRGPNVVVDGKVDYFGLRDLYRKAACVIIPIKQQDRDSGHSATLQAMACGKAVILSDTRGMWDRENFVHGRTCYLVRPEDPEAMRAAIKHVRENPDEVRRVGENARALVEKHFTNAHFAKHLAEAVRGTSA